MPNRSTCLRPDEFAPIRLPDDFPVSELDHVQRAEVSPIGPHVHDCFELGYCYEGGGIFVVESKVLPFRAGDAVVINHQELHVMRGRRDAPARWDFVNLRPGDMLAEYVCAEEDYLDTSRFSGPGFCNLIAGEREPKLCTCVQEIMQELNRRQPGYRSLVRALVWQLLVWLHRRLPAAASPGVSLSRPHLVRLKPALSYIVGHYSEPLVVTDLARRCHSSPANFRKLFHAALGLAPQDYIKKLRLQVAATMLVSTDRPIGEVALESGYPTMSNFNRHFRAAHGEAPQRYRQRHRAGLARPAHP